MIRQVFRFAICGMAGLVLMAGFTGGASAATRQGAWELGPYLGYVFFDSNDGFDINNDFGLGGRGGYFLTKNHEIEFDVLMIGSDIDGGPNVDVNTWTLGYVYNWTGNKDMVPFVRFAFGSTNFDAGSSDEDDTTLAAGGGVRFFTMNNFAIRVGGAILRVDSDPDATNNIMFDGGVSWFLGGSKK